jgi:hypothetical protein
MSANGCLSTARDADRRSFEFENATHRSGKIMRKSLLLTVSALALSSARVASAGQITNLQLYDGTSGSPILTIE